METFYNVAGLFTDEQGNETSQGQKLKQGFAAYKQALDNLDQRRDSGQLDEKTYWKDYKDLNQRWMNVRDAFAERKKETAS